MCGIVGVFSANGQVTCDDQTLIRMRDKMFHRGPDGGGLWRSPENNCALGHRRLSIIDLSSAATQPMTNPDHSVVMVFNGEIYNHAALRDELKATGKYHWKTDHSDTEVLLHAYEEWGLNAFNRCYGMFAVAVFDRRNPSNPLLHLIRDRIGIKPLYFAQAKSGEWIFGSEIKALLEHPGLSAELNKTALWHYLTFIVTPAPLTLFNNIWKLPAGHGITIDKHQQAVSWRWWDSQPLASQAYSERDLSLPEASDELLRLLRQSIQRRMVSDVPFGVLLSGGVDSGLNVALMSELMERPVSTFTIGYHGHEESNEFVHAKRVADRYKTLHHETLINEQEAIDFLPELVYLQDEPIADNVCIPLYFLSRLVKQSGTTVVQVGEGADENFLGYWWCDHYRQKHESVYEPWREYQQKPLWQQWFHRGMKAAGSSAMAEDAHIRDRAKRGQELFWGGAVCWWGPMREQLTPRPHLFTQALNCPVAGLLPEAFSQLDSHGVVRHYLAPLEGQLNAPDVLAKIPYLEHKLRLPEHLLMRVDKMTMAHSIEARVPFLDHDIVNFAMRLPYRYKLNNGIGKMILKKVAEPFLENDLLYRRKQGFGAPMESWFKNHDFSRRAHALLEKSDLVKEGFFDKAYLSGLLKQQGSSGGGYSFHLWTVFNAMLWYECWIKKEGGCW